MELFKIKNEEGRIASVYRGCIVTIIDNYTDESTTVRIKILEKGDSSKGQNVINVKGYCELKNLQPYSPNPFDNKKLYNLKS